MNGLGGLFGAGPDSGRVRAGCSDVSHLALRSGFLFSVEMDADIGKSEGIDIPIRPDRSSPTTQDIDHYRHRYPHFG